MLDARGVRGRAPEPGEHDPIEVTYVEEPSPASVPEETDESVARTTPTAPSTARAPISHAASTTPRDAQKEPPTAVVEASAGATDPSWIAPGMAATSPAPAEGSGPLGLGGQGWPGMINLNLDQHGVTAVVGEAEFRRAKIADSARRVEEHRAPWKGTDFRRWTSALEDYVAGVRPLNQRALGPARLPFIHYVEAMATRIRPVLADDFIGWIRTLPESHPLRAPHLTTRLELVLDRTDGHIVRMGVVNTSGVTAFDVGVLDSVQRASPFGAAPEDIVSPDGRVYVQWDFHELPYTACRPENAHPSILAK